MPASRARSTYSPMPSPAPPGTAFDDALRRPRQQHRRGRRCPGTQGLLYAQRALAAGRGDSPGAARLVKPEIWSGGPALMSSTPTCTTCWCGATSTRTPAPWPMPARSSSAPRRMACRRDQVWPSGPPPSGGPRRAERVTDWAGPRRGGSPPGPPGKTGGRAGPGTGAGTSQHARPRRRHRSPGHGARELDLLHLPPGTVRAWSPLSTNCSTYRGRKPPSTELGGV